VDLSVGTPVDPVPQVIQDALAAAADSPGYPATHGTRRLREAASGWLARSHGVTVAPDAVLPVIGTKEFIAWLPALLGCGPGDTVVHPELAYPTYAIGALLAGARAVATDTLDPAGPGSAGLGSAALGSAGLDSAGLGSAGLGSAGLGSAGLGSAGLGAAGLDSAGGEAGSPDAGAVRLVWVNSPANPTGRVLPVPHLASLVRQARERDAVLASDECYIDLGYEARPVTARPVTARPVSVLHPDACGGSHQGLLAVYSLSKRSNLAGYRAGFVTGDPDLVGQLLEIRRHAGMIVPEPVQAAMTVALDDDDHAARQRERYAARRGLLRDGLEAAGWRIEHSEAGLYLWASRPGDDCWASVGALAEAGILVAPGDFYGPAGANHIRVALTATDERIHSAAARLAAF
jgi:aspartate/methionine/tyrosine aminotransferase